jgi:competence protein ComEA
MPELTKEQLYIMLGIIAVLLIGAVYGLYQKKTIITQSSPQPSIIENKPEIVRSTAKIYIHISGAVINEGIFQLSPGDRVVDALKMAKLSQNADIDSLNLAESLKDGQKIVVPKIQMINNFSPNSPKDQPKTGEKVNINTADEKELDSLPGIGAIMAKRIVEYRTEKGRFASIEELKEVQGISEKKFEKLKKYISVN